jgi:hypothetical protein
MLECAIGWARDELEDIDDASHYRIAADRKSIPPPWSLRDMRHHNPHGARTQADMLQYRLEGLSAGDTIKAMYEINN